MESIRLDAWLNYSCLFKTRSKASKAISLGRVSVNGERAKPHRPVRINDEIRIDRGDHEQIIVVQELVDHNVRKEDAKKLYMDNTPEMSQEQKEMIMMDKMLQIRYDGKGKPGKKERKLLRKMKHDI